MRRWCLCDALSSLGRLPPPTLLPAAATAHSPHLNALYTRAAPLCFVAAAPQTTKSILDGACIVNLTNIEGEEYYITFPTYYGACLRAV